MYKYNFYDFIDSPDIREHLKKFDICLAKQAVFIAISERKSITDKIKALQFLLDNYSEEEFEKYDETINNPINSMYEESKISIVIKNNISYWFTLLEKNNESNRIYAVRYIDVGMSIRDSSNVYFNNYKKAFDYLLHEKEEYYKDTKMYAEIESFVTDDSDIRIICSFDNDLIMYDISHNNDETNQYSKTRLMDFEMYIPLPFKCGDIIKEVNFHRTIYGVFRENWEYNEDSKRWIMDYNTNIDCGEINKDTASINIYWDTVYIPRLEYCSKDELPNKHNILKYISDVRLGEYDMISLLNDITTNYLRVIDVSDNYCTGKGFKNKRLINLNNLPILSSELHEYDYEIDIFYGRNEMKEFNFFIFFNAITDNKHPYMRVTDGNHLNYTKSCRISLIEPEYVEVSDDPLDTWRFNDEEKKEFIKMMNSSAKDLLNHDYIKSDITFWDYLLKEYDFQVDSQGNKCLAGKPMPDYTKLK